MEREKESIRVLVNNIDTWCDENQRVHVLHDHLCTAKERRIWFTMTCHFQNPSQFERVRERERELKKDQTVTGNIQG
jgi:hypothetical protein